MERKMLGYFSNNVELILLLIFIVVLLLLWLLWKIVAEPELSVETDKTVYLKGETVKISGNLSAGGEPLSDKSVTIYITPPVGDVIGLPTVKTDIEGNYSNFWIVLSGAVLGSYSMRVLSLGIEATATFKERSLRVSEPLQSLARRLFEAYSPRGRVFYRASGYSRRLPAN